MTRNWLLLVMAAVFLGGSVALYMLEVGEGRGSGGEGGGSGNEPRETRTPEKDAAFRRPVAAAKKPRGEMAARGEGDDSSSPPPVSASAASPRTSHGVTVTGRILDAALLSPVARAEVYVTSLSAQTGGRDIFARSDAGGNFLLERVPAGELFLRACARGYAESAGQKVFAGEGELVRRDFRLEKGLVLRGRIVDDLSGEPLENAAFMLRTLDEGGASRRCAYNYRTGEDGAFEAWGISASDRRVEIAMDGYCRLQADMRPGGEPRVFRLGKSATLRLFVADARSRAVEAIDIRPEGVGSSAQLDFYKPFFRPAFDREAGCHVFKDIKPGAYRFTVSARLSRSSAPLSLRLEAGKTLAESVTLAQAHRLLIRLRAAGADYRGAARIVFESLRRRNIQQELPYDDGLRLYVFHLEESAVSFSVRAEGFRPTDWTPVKDEGESSAYDLALSRGASVSGVVSSATPGGPVAAALVVATESGVEQGRCASQRDGSYGLPGLPPGRLIFEVSHPDFMPFSAEAAIRGDEALELDILMEQGCSAGGRVLGLDGLPVKGATVRLFPSGAQASGRGQERREKTDPEGSFLFKGLPAGSYGISAQSGGGISPDNPVEIRGGEPLKDIEIRLRKILSLKGTLTDSGGQGLSGVKIIAYPASDRLALSVSETASDGNGDFSFDSFGPGTHYLDIRHPRLRLAGGRRAVNAESGEQARLTAERLPVVRGKVLDPAGKAVDLYSLAYAIPPSAYMHRVRELSVEDGFFAFTLPEPDQVISLVAEAEGHGPSQPETLSAKDYKGDPVLLRLKENRMLRLSLRTAVGEPVVGVSVECILIREVHGVKVAESSDAAKKTVSDAKGWAFIDGLDRGEHLLMVSPKNLAAKRLIARAQQHQGPPIEIVLDEGGSLSGRVAKEGGEPVAKASLVLRENPEGGEGLFPHMVRAFSDEKGGFSMGRVPAGDYDLVAGVPEKEDGLLPVFRRGLKIRESDRLDLGVLTMPRGAVVTVQLSGKDVAGRTLVLCDASGIPLPPSPAEGSKDSGIKALSNEDGKALFNRVGPGTYVVRVRAGEKGGDDAFSRPFEVKGEPVETWVELP